MQIQSILKQRAKEAFHEDSIEPGVIEKCAAYAAKEHGDARRALELLRVAGEIVEREDSKKVSMIHIDQADAKIEKDRLTEVVSMQPKQVQAILYSIFVIGKRKKEIIFTGEVYEMYKKICVRSGLSPLTQRRVSDVIAELDMLGIINAKVISKGRYGRTREITLPAQTLSNPNIRGILEEGLAIS